LKKKFNKTVPEIVSYYEELLAERDELENFQQNQESLILSLSQAQATLNEKAQGLHQARLKAAALLSEKLTLYVQRLKMEEAQISVMVTKIEQLRENGCSDVSVHAEMNPGEGMHCLKDIASGGELSRVLLACRQVMATNDFISIFFFDEIDTGLGGETALSIGKALAEVAVNSQVIAITHLPQLAIYAQKLVEVSKERREMAQETSEADDELLLAKRTFSHIKEYSGSETKRVVEKMTPLF
jgi:DNA repair protein RecN (Recombination protein N)